MKTNFPKLFEGAFAAAFVRANAYAGEMPRLRTWQALDVEGRWSPLADRALPCIDIRASPPRTDDNRHAQAVSLVLIVGTSSADDQDHAQIAAIYEEVQAVADALYADFLRKTTGAATGDATAAWNEHLAAAAAGGHVAVEVCGYTMGEPAAPYVDAGVNVVGLELVVHYRRSDL
jgi:hypothetical protein